MAETLDMGLPSMPHSLAHQKRHLKLVELEDGLLVDAQMAGPSWAMLDACRAVGLDPRISSAYRSPTQQALLLARRICSLMLRGNSPWQAWKRARRFIALPGTSEHELGIALDICSAHDDQRSHDEVHAWLSENAWRFGFIQRYPLGKAGITGIEHEPWHYRYVEITIARELRRTGECLEEYEARKM